MGPDSIDPQDKIQIEVWIREGEESSNTHHESTPEPNEPDEIDAVFYEGHDITNELPMFTDDELIVNDTLETEKSLTKIKALAK